MNELLSPANSKHKKQYKGFSLEEVFHSKVFPEPNSGCWLWTGNYNDYGYGRLQYSGKVRMAHRISYEMHRGDIPSGMVIDHLCRVRCCVNPDHLEVVTPGENTLRGLEFCNRQKPQTRKENCPKGHPYSGDNLYVSPKGFKECRICKRAKSLESKKRRRSHP